MAPEGGGAWRGAEPTTAAWVPFLAAEPFKVEGSGAAISVRLRNLETKPGALVDGDVVYASKLAGASGLR